MRIAESRPDFRGCTSMRIRKRSLVWFVVLSSYE
jgi:hypothetical protein